MKRNLLTSRQIEIVDVLNSPFLSACCVTEVKYVFFVDEYPLTGSGKIQKFKLRELSLKLCAEQGIEVI
jgi:acyl-coenzyme A synthetase/AMP-(fatty) acid ligase